MIHGFGSIRESMSDNKSSKDYLSEKAYSELLSYIEDTTIFDKDAATPKKRSSKMNQKRRKHRKTLDLHGLTKAQAIPRIRDAIDDCQRRGLKELLIIHGWGAHSDFQEGPVLKGLVHQMLQIELYLSVKDFRSALPRDGGEGATVVFLR